MEDDKRFEDEYDLYVEDWTGRLEEYLLDGFNHFVKGKGYFKGKTGKFIETAKMILDSLGESRC